MTNTFDLDKAIYTIPVDSSESKQKSLLKIKILNALKMKCVILISPQHEHRMQRGLW